MIVTYDFKQPTLRATFQPQVWVNDNALDVDGRLQFDAGAALLKLTVAQLSFVFAESEANGTDFDLVAEAAGLVGSGAGQHNGPYYLRFDDHDALEEFLKAVELPSEKLVAGKLTDDDVAAARQRMEKAGTPVPVFVVASGTASDSEDEAIPGVYAVMVDDGLTDSAKAGAALDLFHDENGISNLDDFDIQVLDSHGRWLSQDDDYAECSMQDRAEYLGDIDPLSQEVPEPARRVLATLDLSVGPTSAPTP